MESNELAVSKKCFITTLKTKLGKYLASLTYNESEDCISLACELKTGQILRYLIVFDLPNIRVYLPTKKGSKPEPVYITEYPRKAEILYRWFETNLTNL